MRFEGYYNGESNGEIRLKSGPIFDSREKIAVFDLDGVLVDKIEGNGRGDSYKARYGARKVVARAVEDFDRVVLWSTSPQAFDSLKGGHFKKVDQLIKGAYYLDESGWPVKFLENLTSKSNLKNVVAFDDDGCFHPLNRVVSIFPGDNLMVRYLQGKDIIGSDKWCVY